MKTYIDQLKTDAAEANVRREKAKSKRQRSDARVLCNKPLAQQIQELMLSLPPIQRDRPWSMEELVTRLQGRYGAQPHPMQVGHALRTLGFVRRRDWTKNGEGRRYWELIE